MEESIIILFFSIYSIVVVYSIYSKHVNNKAQSIAQKIFENRAYELKQLIENEQRIKEVEIKIKQREMEEEIKNKESSSIAKINIEIAALREYESKLNKKSLEINRRERYVSNLRQAFDQNYCKGRLWLADFIAEADKIFDNRIVAELKGKKCPAYKTAEVVKETKAEKRAAIKQVKFLEYQLKSYKEYFPFLKDFEDEILSEAIDFKKESIEEVLDDIDNVSKFLSREEYLKLPLTDRNQLALDRYLEKHKNKWEIGRLYERYIGYRYEVEGWDVTFIGAIKGCEDMGRDLICIKENQIHIVQAKCWSLDKVIHEKHVFQLYGTALSYELENNIEGCIITPVLAITTKLSDVAQEAASRLGIVVNELPLPKRYPMVKCNINEDKKIYHLPFDQQYDRIKIQGNEEFYVSSVVEAEKLGFRRAKRYFYDKKK